jgi:hypothetical protein
MTNTAAMRAHADLADYYAQPAVRQRIDEFCMSPFEDRFSAVDVAGYGGVRWLRQPDDTPVRRPLDDVFRLLDEGADVLRSLADRAGTLLVMDLDFVNPVDPAEPCREPERCFERLQPAHRALLSAFARHEVRPLVLMTLAGYRYVARAARGGRLHAGLLEVVESRPKPAASDPPATQRGVALEMELAHRGAGRLLELVAHQVLSAAPPDGRLPIRLADVPPAGGRPFARLDLGSYADALSNGHVRCPFSSDQTPLVGRPGSSVPFVIVLPGGDRHFSELMPLRTDLAAAAQHAASCSTVIPDVADATGWQREYEGSGLAAFHAEMDHAPESAEWAGRTGGLFDVESLPPCASAVLRHPNPGLRQPRHLRTVALALWSMGWNPGTIVALVRSRYEEPHDWGTHWQRHDAARRAAFFVRLFCAAGADGLEDGGAFSCETQRRRGLCPPEGCGYDLGRLFPRLRSLRARYEAHA